MTVYCFDNDGWFVGSDWAMESPLELGTGKYIMPANSTVLNPFDNILVNGGEWRFDGEQWIEDRRPPDIDPRFLRNALLSASDWTQIADAPVDASVWRKYRQDLRDVPQQEGYPFDIAWPDIPKFSHKRHDPPPYCGPK